MNPKKDMLNMNFSEQEIQEVDAFVGTFLASLSAQAASLSPELRVQYGSIREANKLFVNKVKEMGTQRPDFIPREVDWADFEADYDMRALLERWINAFESILTKLRDSKTLLDYDNMQVARIVYRYSRFLFEAGVPGSEFWHRELAQFFRRTRNNNNSNNINDDLAVLPPGEA